MDRISNLPDEIVCQILSFLSTKEAALTSILSKRWRNMFVFTSNICFEDRDSRVCWKRMVDIKSFIDFVDRVLAVSGNLPIKKFILTCRENPEIALIKRLIRKVLKHGVMDLHITARSLSLEVFTCKTLVKLKLGRGFDIPIVPKSTSLPALKTLFLDCVWFLGDGSFQLKALLSACPVLEELTIHYDQPGWCCRVSSMTIQRLIINSKVDPWYDSRSIIFDTPSLAYLDYSGFVQTEYSIVNLDSLVEANLTLDSRGLDVESNPTNLLKGLRNVKILNLLSLETSEILYSFRDAIPVFEKLSRLSIATENESCWELVPLLLKKSPNLETLVIKGPLHYETWLEKNSEYVCECLSGYSFLWPCPIKVLEITEYCGMTRELKQMKHFLEKLQCLELVKVHACANAKFQFDTDLLMLPIAHKIQFKFYPYKLTTASKCKENIIFPLYGVELHPFYPFN